MSSPVLDQMKLEGLLPALLDTVRHPNFIHAQDPEEADLVCVVHWGVAN